MITNSIRLFYIFGLQDIKQRYRRSVIGPFWITLSIGVMIGSIGFVYGALFNIPQKQFLPFLSSGIIIWMLISTCITESCTAFIDSKALINQGSIYYWSHILRIIWRNIIIFAHNMIFMPILFFIYYLQIGWNTLLIIPAVFLLCANLIWIGMILAIFCTRYRDIPLIVQNALQVLFYITPIMWDPAIAKDHSNLLLAIELNPFYHLVQLVRSPIFGNPIDNGQWIYSIGLLGMGTAITILVCKKFNHRIPYWL
jgi:lipopolysaccharide transport system permease protein